MIASGLIILAVICLGIMFLLMAVAAVIWLQNRQSEQEMDVQPRDRQHIDDAAQWVEGLAVEQNTTPQDLHDLQEQVRTLMQLGRKIEAIKAYRQFTGVGLKEAKDAVEAIERQIE